MAVVKTRVRDKFLGIEGLNLTLFLLTWQFSNSNGMGLKVWASGCCLSGKGEAKEECIKEEQFDLIRQTVIKHKPNIKVSRVS